MYDVKLFLLIMVHKVKLAQLIEEDAPYDQILKESQVLDKYIAVKIRGDSE